MSLTQQQFKQQQPMLLEEKHMDTINNIKKLQALEKYMFQNLQKINSQDGQDAQQQQQIISKINELSNMRSGLFNQLKDVYGSVQSDLTDERKELSNQVTVIGVVENELNKAKQNLTSLDNDKNNKLRLVEISNYESARYQAHIGVMRIIAISSVVLLAISILLQRGLIPSSISTGLIFTTLAVAIFLVLNNVRDIMRRSNTDFDKYNFRYDKSSMTSETANGDIIGHDKNLFDQLGGESNDKCGSNNFVSLTGKLNDTLSGLTQTGDQMDTNETFGNMIDVDNQIGSLTTTSFNTNEIVNSNISNEGNVKPVETEGYDNYARY